MTDPTVNLGLQSTANLTVIIKDDDTGLEVCTKLQVYDRDRPEVIVLKELALGMREMLKKIGIIVEKKK